MWAESRVLELYEEREISISTRMYHSRVHQAHLFAYEPTSPIIGYMCHCTHTLHLCVSTFSNGYLSIEYRADAAFQSQGPESELNKPSATCMLTSLDSDKSQLDLD